MTKLLFRPALFACAALSLAATVTAETMNNCRLRGGSMVMLAPEACVMEGGSITTATAVAPAITPAAINLSADPALADAQRKVADLLLKPVVDMDMRKRMPERVAREVKFDGCRMNVTEHIDVDHGNVFSQRMNFKVASSVDLRRIDSDAYGVMGLVKSFGGGMKTYPVFFQVAKRDADGILSIAMEVIKDSGARKFLVSYSSAYWDAPDADLWMADEYGYPKGNDTDSAETSKVRVLYFMNSAEQAEALKKALDEAQHLCKQ